MLLQNFHDFTSPSKNWIIAGGVRADPTKAHDLQPLAGTGVLLNNFSGGNPASLVSKEKFGDLEIELDFLLAKNTGTGIYLEGRYELQLTDSWMQLSPTYADAGGIDARQNQQGNKYEGAPPVMNVAKAPGLWQHLHIFFRAPRFSSSGNKIKNAYFDKVYLNGVLVQQNVFVAGPTSTAMFQDEKPAGPFILQGDQGPAAFRNIYYRQLPPLKDSTVTPQQQGENETKNPIVVEPAGKPYMLRSFMNFGDKKLTHIISFGYPSAVNFSYDMQTGSLFRVWRGNYLDVTRMWLERGEEQLAVPLGAVVDLTDAPAIATLNNDKAAWPDSVAFDSLQHHGYLLDKKRNPLFTYTINGINVSDSIALREDGQGLIRKIIATGISGNNYIRLASANKIEEISDHLFAVGDRSYYIHTMENVRIREIDGVQELIMKIGNNIPCIYSIVW